MTAKSLHLLASSAVKWPITGPRKFLGDCLRRAD
jgi:hypothetical protein